MILVSTCRKLLQKPIKTAILSIISKYWTYYYITRGHSDYHIWWHNTILYCYHTIQCSILSSPLSPLTWHEECKYPGIEIDCQAQSYWKNVISRVFCCVIFVCVLTRFFHPRQMMWKSFTIESPHSMFPYSVKFKSITIALKVAGLYTSKTYPNNMRLQWSIGSNQHSYVLCVAFTNSDEGFHDIVGWEIWVCRYGMTGWPCESQGDLQVP